MAEDEHDEDGYDSETEVECTNKAMIPRAYVKDQDFPEKELP